MRSFAWPMPTSAPQRKESLMTDSFPVAQFDSCQKPFVAYGNVPTGDLRVAL